MAEDRTKDIWDKITALGTFLGGFLGPFALGLIGFLVTSHLSENEAKARKTQLYASVMSEREKAYSDIRAKMFDSLISHYFKSTIDSPNENPIDVDKKITMLELLLSNFDDYFDAEPLFWLLHQQLSEQIGTTRDERKKAQWQYFDEKLIRLAKSTSLRQAATLARLGGGIIDNIFVPLSREVDFSSDTPHVFPKRIALYPLEPPAPSGFSQGIVSSVTHAERDAKNRYSIAIEVHSISEVSADVTIFVFRDIYNDNIFDRSDLIRKVDFESSYFSTPYMDNTVIGNDRFSLVYIGCIDIDNSLACPSPMSNLVNAMVQFRVLVFDEKFLSQKDRPYIDEVMEKAAG
jgi:hypothetical protein